MNLPLIPVPEDLASDVMTHRVDDPMFNPPCAQNEWGHVQCTSNITAFTAQQFPPFLGNSWTDTPWTPIFMPTCDLFLDGRLFASWPRPAGMVRYQWFPHQVVRETEIDGLRIRSELFVPPKHRGAAMRIVVTNVSDKARRGTFGFSLVAYVARANFNINNKGDDPTALPISEPLSETDNEPTAMAEDGGVLFRARHSEAWCMQGLSRRPKDLPQLRHTVLDYSLAPAQTETLFFVSAIGGTREAALDDYRAVMKDFDAVQAENRRRWVQRLRNLYTPDNGEFSGHLPTLQTTDPALWKLYHMGVMTALSCWTAPPDSVIGPTFLAVCGYQRPSRVYLWDTALSARCIGLLDPESLRRFLEGWFLQHPDRHMDLDFITGKSVEHHYATNHMMLVYASQNYLEITEDYAWLEKKVGAHTVLEHLTVAAEFWKGRQDKLGMGLVDHTESELLEVVSSYHGIVAALQAGNVYAMRYVASLFERRGDQKKATTLRADADSLAQRTIKHLYVEGQGFWRAILRDGTPKEVRTCYDLVTVFDLMGEDLSPKQATEMIEFFWRELAGEGWMFALSPRDVDAAWNQRADHTWCGAYPGWPPLSAEALLRHDPGERTTKWIRNLARTANQGPFGQAHAMPGPFPDENGGALKAPKNGPLCGEWAALAGARFVTMVIDTVFGVEFSPDNGLKLTNSRLKDFDRTATLTNLRKGNKKYRVSAERVELAP